MPASLTLGFRLTQSQAYPSKQFILIQRLTSAPTPEGYDHYTPGAEGGTRTRTARATAPSRRRVYQFHHFGIN